MGSEKWIIFLTVSLLIICIQNSFATKHYVESTETTNPEDLLIVTSDDEVEKTTTGYENVSLASNLTEEKVYSENTTAKPFRLPTSFIPYNYKLQIIPALDEIPVANVTDSNFSFSYEKFKAPAKIWISVSCEEPALNITLHSSDISIDNSSITVLKLSTGTFENISGFHADNDTDFFIIFLENATEKGEKYEVFISFVSRVANDRLNGLYADYFLDKSTSNKSYIATTLFAPFHARKAFVCFDEPSFRATFDIIVGRSEKYFSLSNAEINNTQPMSDIPGWHWDTFNTSPSISTYVVAFIVSNLKYTEQTRIGYQNHTTNFRVYAPDNLIKDNGGNFGTNITAAILTEFEEYFEMNYPLNKLYSVALPHFFFSAMENWGLITYKDPVIINMPNVTTQQEIFKILAVASHEVGHQWFGNLVTVKWWSYVWLKEGFSSYYEFHAIDKLLPHLKPWTQFTHESLQPALEFDAGPETHPLDNEIKNASAVADIYTRIPYDKGASILRMMSSFLTEETFQKGIKKYIQKMKYSSAEPNDVYEALQEAVNEDGTLSANATVKEIAETWTTQSGFPLLRIKIENKNELIITQEKFIGEHLKWAKNNKNTSANSSEILESNNNTWWIPVTMTPVQNDANLTNTVNYPAFWIAKDQKNVSVQINTDQLIVLNPRAVGYFRVRYDDVLFKRILLQLNENHTHFAPETRSQLLDDYFKLVFAGYTTVDSIWLLTEYIEKERDYSVWKTFFANLDKPYKLLSTSKYFNYFNVYLLQKIDNVLNLDELQASSGLDLMVQAQLFKWACKLKLKRCVKYSLSLMEKWQKNPEQNPIIADIQKEVYCTAVKALSENTTNLNGTLWMFLSDQYELEFFSVQKDRFLRALSCTENTELLQKLLNTTVDEIVDMHDVDRTKIIQYVVDNPVGRMMTLQFVDENFKSLYKNVSAANPAIECLKTLSALLNTSEDLEKMEMFIKNHEDVLEKKRKSLDKYLDTVKKNIEWIDRFGKLIHSWMDTRLNEVSKQSR